MDLNKEIYAGVNLVCDKIGLPPQKHEQKLKTWMGNSTGNADKKSTTTSKNDKTEEERWNMLGRKRKTNTSKTTKTTQWNKPEGISEWRKTKKILSLNKTIPITFINIIKTKNNDIKNIFSFVPKVNTNVIIYGWTALK